MSRRRKVLVVFDAAGPTTMDQTFEAELQTPDWETERCVIDAVRELGHDCHDLGVYSDTDLIREKIERVKPDIIFNLVESFRGKTEHDRDIVSFFELFEIPYTGCGPTGLTLCKNKAISKQILSYHRIRVPDFVILRRNRRIHRPRRLDFPIFVKPLKEEASYGISQASFVESDDDFLTRVSYIHNSMQQDAIAEEYIEGRELYVSIIGNDRLQVLPIRELKFQQVPEDEPKIATFKAKWDNAYREKWGIRNQFASPFASGMLEKIDKIGKKIYRLLSINGYARLDLRLTKGGMLYFIEANPNPILAREEDFSESAVKSGMRYEDMIQRIINLGSP
jgi:D-alanine-D-alanine ligase